MYIRFETDILFKGTNCKKGIFAALGDLKRRNVMSVGDYIFYRTAVDWFNKNIGVPTCYLNPFPDEIKFNSKSWFVYRQEKYLFRALGLSDLLRKHNIPVNIYFSECPGKVIFRDKYQVVVLPDR